MAVTVVKSLLIKNPKVRCCCTQGIAELKSLPFYHDFDWEAVERKAVKAPYIPEIHTDTDVSSFEATFTREAAVDSVSEKSGATKKEGKQESEGR